MTPKPLEIAQGMHEAQEAEQAILHAERTPLGQANAALLAVHRVQARTMLQVCATLLTAIPAANDALAMGVL